MAHFIAQHETNFWRRYSVFRHSAGSLEELVRLANGKKFLIVDLVIFGDRRVEGGDRPVARHEEVAIRTDNLADIRVYNKLIKETEQ